MAKLVSDISENENEHLVEENQRLRQLVEERNAELAIIQSVQEGLVSRLDVQSIYDLVGDKISGVFQNSDVEIRIYDPRTNLLHFPYFTDNKKRVAIDPIPLTDLGMSSYVLRTGKTVVINENLMQQIEKYGSKMLPGGHPAKSAVFVPLVTGNEARGLIALGNIVHENAFSESDVRLLQTLASSISVALENARLFNETQHLLSETEQRNAELAIINSVQEGLASKLDVQAVYDLVGDQIRDIFHAQGAAIYLFNHTTEILETPYCFLKKRYEIEARPFSDHPIASLMVDTVRPILYRTVDEYRAIGGTILENSEEYKSGMYVPLMVGKELKGMVGIANLDKEYAYNDSDLRLLQTLANSMSAALENARLFDEVQKKNVEITDALERETASNDILRVIAESPTDIQPVLEVIARNAAQLSGSDDAIITLREGDLLRVDAHYGDIPTFSAGEGMRFNRDSVAGRAILEGHPRQAIHNQQGVESEYPEGDKVARKYGYRMTCAVPLMREGKAIGAISIRRIKPQLLTEKQIALIQSFANQAAIAVENVRLFNETTRLLKETEQRAAELQIINSVQEGLASQLDMQAIYDLVGDKIRDLFNAQSVWILTLDPATRTRQDKYAFEKGQRYPPQVLPYNKLTEHLIATKKPLVINQDAEARIAEFEIMVTPGTERMKSAVFVPLLAGEEVNGFITIQNVEQENAFSEADVNLLSTFASSMSITLENLRLFDETQRLLKETEQRNAELAIINSVQEGLSSKLDMQAIYELVGDRMQEIFDAQSLLIVTFDHTSELAHMTYNREKGVRYYSEPYPFTGLHRHLIQSRNTVVINENSLEWQAKFGMVLVPGTEQAKSMIFVPLTSGYKVSGMISLQNLEREHAFSDMDVRLLETLASSMSVALENARLFDETQRLLKETNQRNAELAIINSIQEGLASKLDMQAIYDLVGDKIRELFNAQSILIVTYDLAAQTYQVKYNYEKGKRYYSSEWLPFSKLTEHMMSTKKPLVINQNANARRAELGMTIYPGTKPMKSGVFIPVLAGEDVKGLISVQNVEQENAFSEADVSLLSTFASSMSITLENIRLFDETQRLLQETEQRAAELAIINSVQEGLASKLDTQAVYELVGDKICDLLNARSVWIITFDPAARTRRVRYSFENGQRYYTSEVFPYNKLTEYLITTKKPLVINQNFTEAIERFEMVNIAGTQQQVKSMVYIPIMAGEDVNGFISLPNIERENAFSESDVNLLSTFAFAMSIALENIRLFDETRRLFLETKEAHTAAEQANQAKSAFLSSMSHELRTPLNAIINFVEMVARGMIGPVNREQVELLDQALYSSKHLLNLINDVLDISKIQAGQLTLFIEDEVSVQIEVEATLSIVGGLLQEKGLQLVRDIDTHLPVISCDRRRLRQVLLNLVSNAIKFTDKGTITVSVKNSGQELLFAVIDTGPGIPPDKQDLIFEPFIQAENGERQLQGTGLGLPISRSLIREHGGELWVESEGGEGSAFFFTLPVERGAIG